LRQPLDRIRSRGRTRRFGARHEPVPGWMIPESYASETACRTASNQLLFESMLTLLSRVGVNIFG
jgi:hypothetical protein